MTFFLIYQKFLFTVVENPSDLFEEYSSLYLG